MVFVDAQNGAIIRNRSLVFDANISCTAQTRYNTTNKAILGDSYTGGIRLREDRNSVNVQTMNAQWTTNPSLAIDFINTNTNWTLGSWTDFNRDQAALDAHWGAERVLDYWRTVQPRYSIDNQGMALRSYVHWDSPSFNNAAWVGGNSNFMVYGDNNDNPLTALDIVAHEFGHGVAQYTANFSDEIVESKALNEGFSDIWAACIESWAAPDKQKWLIGEDIFVPMGYSCLRNLQNPKDNNAWEGPHPNTYHGTYWNQQGEEHYNSTVLSHWFYLITEGGTGHIDDNNNNPSYTVNPLGIETAQQIAYWAEMALFSSAIYFDARNASITACQYIFNVPNTQQEIEVTNAWHAVGVGESFHYDGIISGPSTVYRQATYSITNLPSNATVTWRPSNTNLSLVSGQGTGTAVFQSNYYGGCVIYADITIGNSTFTLSRSILTEIDYSLFNNVYIDGPEFECSNTATLTLRNLPQPSTISWNHGPYTTDTTYTVYASSFPNDNPAIAKISAEVTYKGQSQAWGSEFSFSFNRPGYYQVGDTIIRDEYFYYDSDRGVLGVNVSYLFPVNGVNYEWSGSYWSPVEAIGPCCTFEGPANFSWVDITLSFTNPCGQITHFTRSLIVPQDLIESYSLFSLSPNPAANNVTISLDETATKANRLKATNDLSEEYEIQLWSSSGLLKKVKTDLHNYNLSLTGLPAGHYFVHVIKNGKTYRRQLIVQ
ncbi:MAG: M4 family metallopeptidase [Bacteroidales bacterium]|nr:M4 family metallopeptidase [Bacteroidales bacterium]